LHPTTANATADAIADAVTNVLFRFIEGSSLVFFPRNVEHAF
jgi:hypothetical protein